MSSECGFPELRSSDAAELRTPNSPWCDIFLGQSHADFCRAFFVGRFPLALGAFGSSSSPRRGGDTRHRWRTRCTAPPSRAEAVAPTGSVRRNDCLVSDRGGHARRIPSARGGRFRSGAARCRAAAGGLRPHGAEPLQRRRSVESVATPARRQPHVRGHARRHPRRRTARSRTDGFSLLDARHGGLPARCGLLLVGAADARPWRRTWRSDTSHVAGLDGGRASWYSARAGPHRTLKAAHHRRLLQRRRPRREIRAQSARRQARRRGRIGFCSSRP